MAQLVKLMDYVSRYEQDLSHYPTQFVRLKKYQWARLQRVTDEQNNYFQSVELPPNDEQEQMSNWFSSLIRKWGSRNRHEEIEQPTETQEEMEGTSDLLFEMADEPMTYAQLKKRYMDQLYQFQLKWASSTLMARSVIDHRYYRDTLLKTWCQQLPDSYLLFYYPIVTVKKAPVELDIVLMTPVECLCITVLEEEDLAVYISGGDRFWTKKVADREGKILNPLIALNRMEKIVASALKIANVHDYPIKKILLSRNAYIDTPTMGYDTAIIDKRSYANWMDTMKRSSLPIKFMQFKAAQALLDITKTTASSRLFEQQRNDNVDVTFDEN